MNKIAKKIFVLSVVIIFLSMPRLLSLEKGGLSFREDSKGAYASYHLRKGETIYSDVVRRFALRSGSYNDREISDLILKRSGIEDATRIRPGTEIKIPLDLLAREHLSTEAKLLAGVVVILDAGHGGIDTGAIGRWKTYEDEVVYDIMCRIKRRLERETFAEVYTTIRDRSRGYAVNNSHFFPRDRDEYILATPAYKNMNSTVGLHLRWYLANSIYAEKVRRRIRSDKIIFTSLHADMLPASEKGTMIYVPGAYLCRGRYGKTGSPYNRFKEVKENPIVSYSYRERKRSESASRRFAQTLANVIEREGILVHKSSPIRDRIIKGKSVYVPAVLRYNAIPTKILIEVVNLNNWGDCKRIRDPNFREAFAEVYVKALIEYFK